MTKQSRDSAFLNSRNENAACVLLIALYVSVFYLPYLLTGTTSLLPSYQDESQWLLYQDFIARSFRAGFFPLWTPDLYCGMPFLAWSHSASLYPVSAVFALFEFSRAVWINQWLHGLIFATGLYYLGRKAGAGAWTTLIAVAVAVPLFVNSMLSDFLPGFRTGSWGPWLLFATAGLLLERRFVYLAGFVLLNLLMYLGGQTELIGLMYELIAVILIAAGIYYRKQWPRVAAAYLVFGLAFGLGFLIAQVQALPTLELTALSIRGEGLSYGYFKIWSSHGLANLTYWLPYLLTGPILVCLGLAVAGARRSAALFLLTLGLFYCVCLIHDLFGALWVLYRIPVLKDLLAHMRISHFAGIILTVMIALGAEELLRSPRQSRWLFAAGAVNVLIAVVWWAFIRRVYPLLASGEPTMAGVLARMGLAIDVAVSAQALLGLLLLGSGGISRRFAAWPKWALMATALIAYGFPIWFSMPRNPFDTFAFPPEYGRFFSAHPGLDRVQTFYPWDRWERIRIPLQTGILFGTRSADGFITVSVDRYTRFLNLIAPGTFREDAGKIADLEATKVLKEGAFITDRSIPFLNFLGLRWLVTEQRNLKFGADFFLAYPDSPLLVNREGARVERTGEGAAAQDRLIFTGRVSGPIFLQPQDRISVTPENGNGQDWWLALTDPGDDKAPGLVFARFAPSREPLTSALGPNSGQVNLIFAAMDGQGRAVEAALLNPVIRNESKYFQRLPLAAGFNIFENPKAMPPAFLAPSARQVEKDAVLALMADPKFDPTRTALVESEGIEMIPSLPLQPGEGARIDRYAPERVALTATAAAPRLLILTDAYFPGWRAEVDGLPSRLRPVDYAFRGLLLPPGPHRVTLTYQPPSFRLGLFVTLTSLLSLLLLSSWKCFKQ